MKARPFTEADLEAATAIVRSHPTMYGIKINHDPYLKGLTRSVDASLSITIENDDGTVFGVAKQHHWGEMPSWSVGAMFFEDHTNSPRVLQAGKALMNFMTERAESQGRYDFYYVVRDSGETRKRMSLEVNPVFAWRYDIVDVEVIRPFQIPKYKAFARMLAGMAGKNTKTLVVRHGYLKPEHRQDVWKTQKT